MRGFPRALSSFERDEKTAGSCRITQLDRFLHMKESAPAVGADSDSLYLARPARAPQPGYASGS